MNVMTTRLDLKEGIVLISDKMTPFKIVEKDSYNRRVKGILLMTGEEVFLPSSTATLPIEDKWIKQAIEKLKNDIEDKNNIIKTLENILKG